jgi:hypothetical protein
MIKNDSAARSVGQDYVSPSVEQIPILTDNVLCESPLPGGNEGIGFENWN